MSKVMVVDDSAFMRMRCVSLLAELGHETEEAGDGDEALDVFKRSEPDAVLLDITMPGKDGLTVLRDIMALDPRAKVVMVTAMGQQGMIAEALAQGAKDFIVKPFEAERVKEALEKLGIAAKRAA